MILEIELIRGNDAKTIATSLFDLQIYHLIQLIPLDDGKINHS
ncbi:hypothetical protein BN193_09795 [Lactococcus raffinolactis 4877]|nr:hypothetical protein BN193_09795 [Lactococcus raffinolactis 4877]